jgi:Putative zinc-finger
VTERTSCEHVREVAPDVALGLLTGEERAEALDHLEGCEACRAEVASLAVTADEVLLASPEADPPPGFADRVLARLAAERAAGDGLPAVSGAPRVVRAGSDRVRTSRRGRRLRVVVLAAAAAVVLVVAGLVAVRGDGGGAGDAVAVAVMRTGTGRVVGEVTAVGGAPTMVTLDVSDWDEILERWGDAPAGNYWLVAEHEDGTRTMRALAADVDDWSMRVDAPVDEIATVSMVDSDGRVWCTGWFDTT